MLSPFRRLRVVYRRLRNAYLPSCVQTALIFLVLSAIALTIARLTRKPEVHHVVARPAAAVVVPADKGFCEAGERGCKDGKAMPLLVHLDLKGSPPTVAYLEKFMPFAKSLGATGFLVEYEDTFPYSGLLAPLQSTLFSYSKDDVKHLVGLAHELHMSVVPLVQTYGHMEFVLKHDEFKELREEANSDWSVCPQRHGTEQLLHEMIDQVMSLHPHSRHLHIGGDEVVNMGRCPLCRKVMAAAGGDGREELYRQHMLAVMKHVSSRWKGVRSLFWDDMVRRWDVPKLKTFSEYGEPMAWSYVDDAERVVSTDTLRKFASAFPRVWLASSFKGSAGQDIDWVPVRHHVNNHYSWNKLIQHGLPSVDSVGGFVLTGWSRYMHHLPLCELLPAGIPSLALCLTVAARHETQALAASHLAQVSSKLGFQQSIPVRNEPHANDNLADLKFPGHEAYSVVFRHALLLKEYEQVKQVFDGRDRAKFAHQLSRKAVLLAEDAEFALGKVFPKPAVQEWLRTKLSPILQWSQKYAS